MWRKINVKKECAKTKSSPFRLDIRHVPLYYGQFQSPADFSSRVGYIAKRERIV